MTPLDPGTLNRRIAIEAPGTQQDAYGQPQQTWTQILNCYASINAASSKEVYAAAGFVQQLSHVIRIRFVTTPINNGMRVLYGSRSFDVQAAVDPDESRVVLVLYCLERNA